MKRAKVGKLIMTKLQALFVLYWRHESLGDCSWRMLADEYYSRYGEILGKVPKMVGNQLDDISLEVAAFKILLGNQDPSVVGFDNGLYSCDLTYINANLKRHIDEA